MKEASNMKTLKPRVLLLVLVLVPACGGKLVEFPNADGGKADSSTTDTAKSDGAKPDTGIADVATTDSASIEVAIPDAGMPDTAPRDSAIVDSLMVDSQTPDQGNRDTRGIDALIADTRLIDVANPDTGSIDVPIGDVRITDAPILDASRIEGPRLIDATIADTATPDVVSMDTQAIDVGGIDGTVPGPAIIVSLGLAKPFAIAATAGVTNTITVPITHINGDVVLTPDQTCNAVTVDNAGGFGLCGGMPPTISGTVITNVYPDTTTAAAIKADLNAAFLSLTPLAGPPAVGSLAGGIAMAAPTTLGNAAGSPLVLGDNWFTPGVYTSITSILITGDITLDGQGDPNAAFVFQSASSLTTSDGAPSPGAHARVLLTNGTKASNVWWQVASSATLGSYSEFQGSILAAFNITMKTGSTACGRSMAGAWVGGAGAYIFDSNVVSIPGNGCPL
jgi:hypothetical protein